MKNNHGFSNILIITIIVIFLSIVAYFIYPYFFKKNLTSTSNVEKSDSVFVNYRNVLKFNIPEGYEVKEEVSNEGLSTIIVSGEFTFIVKEEQFVSKDTSPKFTYLKNVNYSNFIDEVLNENHFYVTFTTQIDPEKDNEENLNRATLIRDNLVKSMTFLKSTPLTKESCVKEKGCNNLEVIKSYSFFNNNKLQFKDNNHNLYDLNVSPDIASSFKKVTKFNDKLLVLKENSKSKPGFLLINLKDGSYEDLELSIPSNFKVSDLSIRGNQILFVGNSYCKDCNEIPKQKDLYIYEYENKSTKLLKKDFIIYQYVTFLNSDNSKANFIVEGQVPYSWKIVQVDLKNYNTKLISNDDFYRDLRNLNIKIYDKLIFSIDNGLNFEDEIKFEDYSSWGDPQNFIIKNVYIY